MMSVNALVGEMNRHLAEAERRGLSDLVRREDELSHATGQALRAVIIWLAIGLFFLPVVLLLAYRRLGAPLRDLEAGLTLVAEGDLHAQVPVRHADEIGRLADHFNHMTSVLRERAEEQGRFAAAGELIAGVAHEVNNPLMAISAITQQRLEDNDLRVDDRQDLMQILRQSRRAGKLLQRPPSLCAERERAPRRNRQSREGAAGGDRPGLLPVRRGRDHTRRRHRSRPPSGLRRPRPARAGVRQPPQQRDPCRPPGRPRRATITIASGADAGRRLADALRQWARHSDRRPPPALPSLRHDQGTPGHRTRPVHLPADPAGCRGGHRGG